jgi:BMFP domain-containing protein YqiC
VLHHVFGNVKNSPPEAEECESMKPDPRIFDDISRVAGGAMNVFSGLREQIMSDLKTRFDEMAARMDLVPREDFERLELQVKDLQKKIDTLSGGKTSAKKEVPKKPAAKKTGKKK